jgi:internalin A
MLEAAETDGMTIFWIPVRPSAFNRGPLAKFQAAHLTDRPLASLRGAARDQAFVDIGEKLANVLEIRED